MFSCSNKIGARYYCKIARFRNSSFTKTKFLNLQFNKYPRLDTDIFEGYDHKPSKISVPIIEDNQYDTYDNIIIEYPEPIITNCYKYDKKLHESYKTYYTNEQYHVADVFDSYWDGYQIYCVDFNDSLIASTHINTINFRFTSCKNTTLNNVIFTEVIFKDVNISDCVFENCTFSKCHFDDVDFVNTKFVDCEFNDSLYRDCNLNIDCTDTNFNKIFFQHCMIPIHKRPDMFKRCTFNTIDTSFCTHSDYQLISKKDFDNYVKSLE